MLMVIMLEEKLEHRRIIKNKNENLNTFISIFPHKKPKYALLVMLENPKVAKELIYDYRELKLKVREMRQDGTLFMLQAK